MSNEFVLSKEVPQHTINQPAHPKHYAFRTEASLNDLYLFTQGQPFELYQTLRENAPVYFHDPMPTDPEPGYWALTSYEDIKFVSMNPQIFSSQYATGNLLTLGEEENRHPRLFQTTIDHMLNLDGEMHLGLRKEHMPFFRPNFVAELQEKVSLKISALLDNISDMGECNLVKEVSQQLPIFTLSEILGIPEADRQKLVDWMEFLELAQYFAVEQIKQKNEGHSDNTPDPAMIDMFNAMVDEMFDYGKSILQAKREKPSNDLLSAIANAKIEGEKLSQEFLDGSWLLIIIAGNETTRNSISGTIKLLTENPDQKEKLINNMELLPNMVNEAIRLISPVIYMRRTTTEETQVGEQKIGPQEKVVLYYGAANRDPDIFTNPDKFDIERENAKKHLAFGYGRHLCLGKHMANMQLAEVYKQILERFPDMHQSDEWKVVPNNFTHSISEMPVAFKPE